MPPTGWLIKSVPPPAGAQPWCGSTEAWTRTSWSEAAHRGTSHLSREGTPPAVITIGIDPHKTSLTAVALDATGQQVAARRVVVNAAAPTRR